MCHGGKRRRPFLLLTPGGLGAHFLDGTLVASEDRGQRLSCICGEGSRRVGSFSCEIVCPFVQLVRARLSVPPRVDTLATDAGGGC